MSRTLMDEVLEYSISYDSHSFTQGFLGAFRPFCPLWSNMKLLLPPAPPTLGTDLYFFHLAPLLTFNSEIDPVNFTLMDGSCLPRSPTESERAALSQLFPSQLGFGVDGPFLVVYVKELPAKPWPRFVAGLLLYLTTTPFASPLPVGSIGIVRWSALRDLDATRTSSEALYHAVIDFFENEGVQIQEIQWFFGCWRIVLPENTEISKLPGKLCRVAAFYFSKGTSHNVPRSELARRTKQPA
ncbi:hypothetical protein MGYG_04039 [Nannizzia gypsea CBS 118893]|uniref:Uncharacterized protein n=1 Tax=Arthroderma gypseum (strain ATCC MYA-4604 / CBS 118893) TaxID=535722 RepID=E4UUR9_ARTGP|nr:hypothetical protein MGYG_04039 [Nannizzia gypsea CBS 118893]EFR01036.1 hypothetical protein MGYG_04039 [Nannizzia gypsea CBS 118893]